METHAKFFIAVLALVACYGSSVAECPRGEWPCAVVEIDRGGALWVDGKRGTIQEIVAACTESEWEAAAILPDFDTAIADLARVWSQLEDRGVHLHTLTPCDRVELQELFGLDPVEMCAIRSDRPYIGLEACLAPCRSARASTVNPEEDKGGELTVEESTPFSTIDVAARRMTAYSRAGVAIIVHGSPRRPGLTLAQEHSFIAPPPVRGHEKDGGSCFYPDREPEARR